MSSVAVAAFGVLGAVASVYCAVMVVRSKLAAACLVFAGAWFMVLATLELFAGSSC